MTTAQSPWRETGDTSLPEFSLAVSRSWNKNPSPMTEEAEGVYDAAWAAGLSRLCAAMSWHETKNMSWNCDTAPTGQPCIPASTRNAWAMKTSSGAWAKYSSWFEAANDWARRLLDPAGPYAKTTTIRELIDVYAPGWDGNDTAAYVKTICDEIDNLPLLAGGGGGVPVNPFPKPATYSLAKDWTRYGLSVRQRDEILGHRFPDRQGLPISAIVLHIQEGNTKGSLAYWASPGVNASSSVMVQKDGSLLRVIEDQYGPWTNGDVQNPSEKGRKLLDRIGWANPNLVSVSIEAEGYYQDAMPDAQLSTICWMVTEWMNRHGLTVNDVYRHADINSVTRPNCPGVYFDRVIAKLGGAAPIPPAISWPGKPAWMPDWLVKAQFPEAEPNGTRTNAWLAYCGEAKRAPSRVKFHQQGTDGELIEFSDGLFIDKAGRRLGG